MNLLKSPYNYQIEGAQFALDHHYCVIGDSPGLGKTLQALLVWYKTGLPTVVVCPGYLRDTWRREIEELFALPPVSFIIQDKHDAEYISKLLTTQRIELNFIIISYELLDKCPAAFRWGRMYIADECHYLKNVNTKRTRTFHAYLQALLPDRFIGLSGTPIKNNATEWFSILTACSYNPKGTSGRDLRTNFRSYISFAENFGNKRQRAFGGRKVVTYSGCKNVSQLKELLQGKYIRRLVENVLELPEVVEQHITCSSTNEDSLLARAWAGGVDPDDLSRIKRDCAIAKASFTLEHAKSLLEQDAGPIVVFSDHLLPVEEISQGLDKARWKVAVITGSVSTSARSTIVREFQEGKWDALVATIGSASTGFTLHRSNQMVFNDIPWVPADLWQAQKRIMRIGQKRTCFYSYMVGSPIDGTITKTLQQKVKVLEKSL